MLSSAFNAQNNNHMNNVPHLNMNHMQAPSTTDLMSQSDMSVCEQSFHFSQTAKGGTLPGGPQSEYSQASAGFNPMADNRGASQLSMLGGIGSKGGFANLDDAKTLSQADGI